MPQAAIIPAATLAVSAASAAYAAKQSSDAAGQAQDASNAGLRQNQSLADNQRRVTEETMRRASAGTRTGTGSTVEYQPGGNTWVSQLSPHDQQVQGAADQAAITRNSTDVAQSEAANRSSAMQSALRSRIAEPSMFKAAAYKDVSPDEMESKLQDATTTANRTAQQPIIADTLRAMVRSGTAAGPVLTEMMRGNATNLQQSLRQNATQSFGDAAGVNSATRKSLTDTFGGLGGGSSPQFQFPGIQPSSIDSTLSALGAKGATNATQAGGTGAYSAGTAMNSSNQAYDSVLRSMTNPGGLTMAVGDRINKTLESGPVSDWLKKLLSSGGNADSVPTPYLPPNARPGGNYGTLI